MAEPSQLAAPVTALFAAVDTRDRDLVGAALADDVRLEVPSLGYSCAGRSEVLNALGTVLIAFPDFRYQVRSRYLAPGHVIDEAVLEGTHSGPLLGAPANGRAGTVPARLMVAHDGRTVTAVTVWADGGALRELVDLPETLPGRAHPLVSQLRATLPVAESRVILAQDRDTSAACREAPAPTPATPPRPRITAPRTGDLKLPVPRRIRRLQGAALALVMLGAITGLVAWMVSGTVRSQADQRPAAVPTATPTPRPTAARTGAGAIGSVPLTFNARRNEYEFSSDLLFDTDSAQLTPQARQALEAVVTRTTAEHRWGTITVTGYTDSRGPAGYNLRLSQDRADAVAAALRQDLAGSGTKVRVVSVGKGESDPATTGTSADALKANRRVTVQVPRPSS
ncbi:MAG TPA: OmpA family protein [Kineosporiaceae bacterium]|nr:OmpA family protein [Kineosporiaceae bacterium]